MRKLEKRAILCLILAGILMAGIVYFITQLVTQGGVWVSFPANEHIYKNGSIATGTIYDVDGELLVKNKASGSAAYNEDEDIRVATMHAVGDKDGNIATGADTAFADKLVGYNILTGIYTINNKGRNLYLTIDADICEAAMDALGDHEGTVGVYNYKTGEIICMVSSPSYDPLDPPEIDEDDDSGIFMNKFITATVVPGSTFKLVTSAAAIEQLDYENYSYNCTGSEQYGSAEVDTIRCTSAHGEVDFEEALAKSCNCAFGDMATKIGDSDMEEYTEKAGLKSSYSIDGIKTTAGSFEFPDGTVSLAWAGIGQYQDLVNPCSMMVYCGAIANGGKAAVPKLIDKIDFSGGLPASLDSDKKTDTLIDEETADVLGDMMHNNVVENYGTSNYPGLDICAKSGTAEVGDDKDPHAWFVGYIRNEGYPYAFVTLVENGGYGSEAAGSVTNEVLQEVIDSDSLKVDD